MVPSVPCGRADAMVTRTRERKGHMPKPKAAATRTVTYTATAEPESWASARGVEIDNVTDDLAAYLVEATNVLGVPVGVEGDITAVPHEAQPATPATTVGEFPLGATIFVAESADDWMAYQIVGSESDDAGSIPVEVVWTGGVPGFEVGQRIVISPDVPAWETLTVEVVTAQAQRAMDDGSIPACVTGVNDGILYLVEGNEETGPAFGRITWDDAEGADGDPGYVLRIGDHESYAGDAREVVRILTTLGYMLDDCSRSEIRRLADL